jgi:hypothetical protein
VTTLRRALDPSELGPFALAALLVLVTVAATAQAGPSLTLGPLLALLAFAGTVACFLRAPHVAVAASIVLFSVIPALKLFVSPWIGPSKDAIVLAATVAVLLHVLDRGGRATAGRTDSPILLGVLLFLMLYVVNLGGATSGHGYGLAWFHGVRLVAEPILLLVAGLLLPYPRRSLRWGTAALVGTSSAIALYGIAQEVLGPARLVALGYSYSAQVFTVHGRLRAFGTLDDTFAYAALLMLALATVIFTMRRGLGSFLVGALLTIGIAVAIVQTSVVELATLTAVALVRARKPVVGLIVLAAIAAIAIGVAVGSRGVVTSQSVNAGGNTFVTLNGRTTVWRSIFSDRARIPLGLGVGAVGTAAARAHVGVTKVTAAPSAVTGAQAVDSGYFATVADIGIVGLCVLVFLLGRLIWAARQATRGPYPAAGWLALAYLAVMAIDALTRDSFTGFPNSHLGLLMVGLALASARDAELGLPAAPGRGRG